VSVFRSVLAVAALAIANPEAGLAQQPASDLMEMSIEDLMNIEVTSVSHKEQRANDVAAAIHVITQDDIRRSGMTTLPELLRLVPGVQVARINSNKWAIAIRGFNNLFASKVLVVIDGRTAYDRLNSGVFWESLNIPLDQIERIEVVRGPGGATWGAGAVNGVISIVTKSATDLPGAAVSVGAGTLDGARASARYGGVIGGMAYRLYSQWAGHGQSLIAPGTPANDAWQSQTHGIRVDRAGERDTFMAEGGATLATLRGLWHAPSGPVPAVRPPFSELSYTREYTAVGRWVRRRENGASMQVQSSFDYRHNEDGASPTQIQTDVDAKYHTAIGRRHDVVVGAGYRLVDESVRGSFGFSIAPGDVTENVLNVFAQDEIALGRRISLTLGTKVERDSYVGWGIQPTVRVMWTVTPQQHLWGAVSRAIRTPSLGDISVRNNFRSFVGQGGLPTVVGALGNPAFKSETVLNTDVGYRRQIGSVASIDVTAFMGRYGRLKTSEPLPPRLEALPAPAHLFVPVQFANLLEATSYGIEMGAHWLPAPWWRLDGGLSTFRLTPHISPASRDVASASFDGNAPRAQWHARSAFSLGRSVNVDLTVFRTGALSLLQVPAYTRADVRLELPLTRVLSLAVLGQNLLDRAHLEYAGQGAIVTPTLIPRSGSIMLMWTR
jgi:iron complex outermembrane recepter protein